MSVIHVLLVTHANITTTPTMRTADAYLAQSRAFCSHFEPLDEPNMCRIYKRSRGNDVRESHVSTRLKYSYCRAHAVSVVQSSLTSNLLLLVSFRSKQEWLQLLTWIDDGLQSESLLEKSAPTLSANELTFRLQLLLSLLNDHSQEISCLL